MRLQIKQGSQRTFLSFAPKSAFIQNCQWCSFYRSPKEWFYTVSTHYCHSLLKADPVTHVSPAAGPPSLDVPPTCHPSVWSPTKGGTERRSSSANRERDVSKYDSVIAGRTAAARGAIRDDGNGGELKKRARPVMDAAHTTEATILVGVCAA